MRTLDLAASESVTIPTASLISIIDAALRMVNSTIGRLTARDVAHVLEVLQNTNAVASHAARRIVSTNPAGSGVGAVASAAEQLDRDAQEVADLTMYFEAMSSEEFEQIMSVSENEELEEGSAVAGTQTTPVPAVVVDSTPAAALVPVVPSVPAAALAPVLPSVPASAAEIPVPIGLAAPDAGLQIPIAAPGTFEIPRPYVIPPVWTDDDWPEKWYVVTRGTRVGIFTTSQEASLYTIGVSTSERKAYKLWPKAQAAYKNALEKGCVAVL